MNKAGLILEKIARLTRVIRLKRHTSAIADAVGAMSPTELLQLRSAIESVASSIDSSASDRRVEGKPTTPDSILDELSKISLDRQLNSDSAIVRIRYIARWLTQVIHLTVGEDNADVRAIYRNAVTILRRAQSANPSQEKSWFITKDKKVS
jgi:hypothetical protein